MKFSNEIWAVVPARSGSKSIKHKNIKKFDGKPLLAHSIIIAKRSKNISNIIFSSDSQKYINIAKKYGDIIAHKRSIKNSSNNATDFDLFKEIVNFLIKKKIYLPKFFVHLRPTTPLRKISHIDNAIKIMKKNSKNYNSLRSINSMSQTSYKTLRIVNKKLCGITKLDFDMDKFNLPRNMYSDTFEANGIVDIYKTKNIINGYLLGKKVFPYKIDFLNSDINTQNDFKIFEKLKTI